MKPYRFNKEKDTVLKNQRGVGFDQIIKAITNKQVLKIIEHPNKKRYPNQKIYLVILDNYVFSIPFVEEKDYFFLKTIIPSRKYTKLYHKKLQVKNKKI
ncbi:toxin [Candidatus Roizmanbacteria bacterium]|nr:toxin [Candidatus Roizmanbacteria bacterium]